MDVYLVRHAIAERRDPHRWPDDSARPLTPEGIDRFRRAAAGLRTLVPTVELMLSSEYVRAWHTAELLREVAGWPEPQSSDALVAEQSPQAGLDLLQEHAGVASIALVGHEPYLSSLASLLLAGSAHTVDLELKKGGVVFLALARPAAAGVARLRWSLSPKILRALAPA